VTLAFTGPAAWPWRLARGHVSTLDDYLGHTFASGTETVEECGDWHPTLRRLRVIRLLGPARPSKTKKGSVRANLDVDLGF
jgi:hypothetical protein